MPCKSTAATISSKPSFLTRTEYFPGLTLGAANLPDSSDVSTIGWDTSPPLISIRAFTTTAPVGSLTVPEIVSARRQVANARQSRTKIDARRKGERLKCRSVLAASNKLGSGFLRLVLSGRSMGSPEDCHEARDFNCEPCRSVVEGLPKKNLYDPAGTSMAQP